MILIPLLSLLLSANPCVERNLAHFYRGALEVAPELIGTDDPCDGFGGAGVRTPRHRVWVFVNFNIPARIDVDAIDDAIDALPPDLQRFLEGIAIAVVEAGWIERRYGAGADGSGGLWCLSWDGSTFFIDARVAGSPEMLRELLQKFYSDPREGT